MTVATLPIMQHAKAAGDLKFIFHICPTFKQAASSIPAASYWLFASHIILEAISHICRTTQAPMCIKMAQFPLWVSTINEATVEGTIKVLENIYEKQLWFTPAELEDKVVPSINDQLTNAHTHVLKIMQSKDWNLFRWIDNIQLRYGIFCNLWTLYGCCWRHIKIWWIKSGASVFFCPLGENLAGNEKPDYHTLVLD